MPSVIAFPPPLQEHQAGALSRQAQALLPQLLALAFVRPPLCSSASVGTRTTASIHAIDQFG